MSSGGLSARHEQVGQIFLEAAALADEEREHYLRRRCRDDPELRSEVERLLAYDDPSAPDDARHRLGVPSAAAMLDVDRTPPPNESVDGFELLEILGHGSMGVVYLARQRHPDREVALKLLHPSLLGSSAARRFRREVQFLARLSHPGIAQIHGAGVQRGETGERPYLVMEHIRGLPLNEYAREARLDTSERLTLMRRVCEAVQHAHERGILHRDLKPANILVTESGQPKLVDFGAASALDVTRATRSLLTSTGEWVGTVAYMSPEQWDTTKHGVDERADVYALGVILYELLSGKQPHDLGTRSLPEALKLLAEEDPEPLSRIDRRLAGDLETLVNTAMARDRRKRYASARELSEDLRRFLEQQPLAAQPPSLLQVMTQRIRRHPVFSAVLTSILLGVTVFAFVERAHKEEVASELEHTRQVSDFVARFIKSRPDERFASEETVTQMLERADEFVTEAAVSPVVEGGFRVLVGNAYKMHAPDKLDDGERHIARGLELLCKAHGELDHRSLRALLDLVTMQIERAQNDPARLDAAERSQALLDARLARATDVEVLRVSALHRHGLLAELRGDVSGVRHDYERVVREGRDLLALDDRAWRDAVLYLAELELEGGDGRRAEEYLQRCERELGVAHPVTLGTRLAWANKLRGRGNREHDAALVAASRDLLAENAEQMDRSFGRCAPRSLEAWIEVVSLHAELGEYAHGEQLMREQFRECPSTPAGARLTALRHWVLGNLLLEQAKVEEAATELLTAYEHLPENLADDPRMHVIVLVDLARTQRFLGRLDLGVARLREAYDLALRLNGPEDRYSVRTGRMLERFEQDLAAQQAAPPADAAEVAEVADDTQT